MLPSSVPGWPARAEPRPTDGTTGRQSTAEALACGTPARGQEYDSSFMRLEQPSRRIVVEIVLPSGPVSAEPAVAEEPEVEPQPQPQA